MEAVSAPATQLMRCVGAPKASANTSSEPRTRVLAVAGPALRSSSGGNGGLRQRDMSWRVAFGQSGPTREASGAAQLRCGDGALRAGSWRWVRAVADSGGGSSLETNSAARKKREYFLPTTLDESIDQARAATREAIQDGVKRLQLEVPLPLIGASDLDDWPGGIQQQYKAAGPVVASLLAGLVDEADCRKYMIDEGDAVGVWESDQLALVLFPTAETLAKVEGLAKNAERPLLILNTQWQSGQVISDFGFGSVRRAREEFVKSFDVVYQLKSMRILGEDLRLLKRYPGDWQIFVLDAVGAANECAAVTPQRPSYKELEAMLRSRKDSKANQGWFARLFSELEFNKRR